MPSYLLQLSSTHIKEKKESHAANTFITFLLQSVACALVSKLEFVASHCIFNFSKDILEFQKASFNCTRIDFGEGLLDRSDKLVLVVCICIFPLQ